MNTEATAIGSLKIGEVRSRTNLVLSPMSGITDCAFRRLVREMSGPALGLVVSEFVSAEGLTRGNAKTRAMLRLEECERPISIQIFGADVDRMARAAEMAEEAGADIIDVNCGCPAPKVVRRGGGAELMRQPDRLRSILRAIRRRVSIPMTVKIRSGWDDASLNAMEIARLAAGEGAAMLAVHGRTRRALYTGAADWDLVARIKREIEIPIVGSGDLADPDTVLSRMDETGVDGVMIGRTAIYNPWIFSQVLARARGLAVEQPAAAERMRAVLRFRQLLAETSEERAYLGRLRGIACRLVKGIPGSAATRQALGRARSADEVEDVLGVALGSGRRLAEVA